MRWDYVVKFNPSFEGCHESGDIITPEKKYAGTLGYFWDNPTQIIQLFASYMMVTHRYQTLLHQVKAFIRFKDLPKRMSRRIYSYLNFRFQYWVFNERVLMDSLCLTLKNEILWHTCQSLVTKVETFKELPPPVMMKLVTLMKPEIYLPNDVVVHAGEVGSEMFFIYVGVLAVFTESGKEVFPLLVSWTQV
ncbi:hypothetical protein HHI36_014949 [Cryptolaemus montrouzieri]|uniref:Cyclic nucleotide-binding domain-containing protein n=1 Tax=Cryptolaemus montrouzieri TaxID=559131 RepID=A0ABD2N4N6_9CUCU